MHHYLWVATATAAIPLVIFCWMIAVVALVLIQHGENPRAALLVARTLLSRDKHSRRQ